MANKTTSEKNKPTRKTLRADEYYNPKTKRYEYHYKDALGKERVVSSYKLEPTDQLPKGKKSSKSLRFLAGLILLCHSPTKSPKYFCKRFCICGVRAISGIKSKACLPRFSVSAMALI